MEKELLKRLEKIKKNNLCRKLKSVSSAKGRLITLSGKEYINFSSNNYMGLATDERLKEASIKGTSKWGAGSSSSRLVCGNLSCYDHLEECLAEFKKKEASLVYPTGYMTNVGIIPSLTDEGDALIIDRLNHASIIDGAKLSKAKLYVYKHCDAESLETVLKRAQKHKNRLVVTESIFSMDGDAAPLKEIVDLCGKYDASLVVDEAHATGVFGKNGRGLMSELGLSGKSLIDMGTFSKALGSMGGFVCSSKIVKDYLVNTSRSLIYTTALAPGVVEANIEALRIISEMDEQRDALLENSGLLRDELKKSGFDTLNSCSQIIPVVAGDNKNALALGEHLKKRGFFAPAIRFPTVPKNTARIRISLTCLHTKEDIASLVDAIKEF